MWQSKSYIKTKIFNHNKRMSNISYYKMMVVGNKIKTHVHHAHKMCAQNPKSQSCRVAWDQVEELCATMNDCKMSYSVQIKDEEMFGPELPWEEESRFYDV
jgi:hypothetical protein